MSSESQNNSRIATNTVFLYIRMLLLMVVGLFTSRVILQTLGDSDYGLNNVVAGVVTMFTFLNATLSSSTQRFLNYELGTNNTDKLKKIFSTSLLLHVLLAIFVIFTAETVGLWFVCNKLNIPEGRYTAALWVYHNSIISAAFTILSLPYTACIIAHEKMNVYAYMSLLDAGLKLGIVYLLWISPMDKLILYSILFLIVHIVDFLVYFFYCIRKYDISRVSIRYYKCQFKEMISFTGWNVVGSLAGACNGQGLNILLNMFFGTTVNAARGIAYQVNNIIVQFARNFQVAANPQIVKNFAAGKFQETERLVYNSAKFSGLMLLLLTIPFYIEIETILKLWLGDYPEFTPVFVRIVLFQSLITAMTGPIVTLIQASGKLKAVALTAGNLLLLILPVCYVLLKGGCSASEMLMVSVLPYLFEPLIELYWMHHYTKFPIWNYYKKVYLIVFALGAIMFAIPYGVKIMCPIPNDIVRCVVVCSVSVICSVFVVFRFGLSKNMQNKLIHKLLKKEK